MHERPTEGSVGAAGPGAPTRKEEAGGNGHARGHGPLHRLLRYSHIFSAAVHEVLEEKFLRAVTPLPLTLPQLHLLRFISLHSGHQVGEVAEFMGMSSPAASKNIDKLVRRGLVTRSTGEEDRRVTRLSASAAGHGLVNDYERFKAERLTPVLDGLRPEEVDELARLLERFSVLLFDQEGSGTSSCMRCAAYCAGSCPIGHVMGSCPHDEIRARTRLCTEGDGDPR